MTISYSGICDIGCIRKVNQDSILMMSDNSIGRHLFVVSDGMGGHADGEYASKAVVDGLNEWWIDNSNKLDLEFYRLVESLQGVLKSISHDIYSKYKNISICGATCILLLIDGDKFAIVSSGDSRIYMKKGPKITSVMKDDVWENQSFIRDNMSDKMIKENSNYGKLVSAIGALECVRLNVKCDEIDKVAAFMLCSDGLYKYCSKYSIMRAISKANSKNIHSVTQKLIKKVYSNGGKDNVSVIMVVLSKKE